MTVDPTTGRIVLHELGIALGPTLTRSQFLRLPVASASTPGTPHERWFRYQLPVVPQRDTELYAVLHFDRERLASLDLFHSAERFGNPWAGWTQPYNQAQEQARKTFHEQWLNVGLALPCGTYRWGEVRLVYDPNNGVNSISITYHAPNAWQVAGRAAGRWWGAASAAPGRK